MHGPSVAKLEPIIWHLLQWYAIVGLIAMPGVKWGKCYYLAKWPSQCFDFMWLKPLLVQGNLNPNPECADDLLL
jgi:hypothetical protein